MTQTTNNQNENEYTWARRPGSSSESTDAASVQAPVANASSEFAAPGGSAWASTPTGGQTTPIPAEPSGYQGGYQSSYPTAQTPAPAPAPAAWTADAAEQPPAGYPAGGTSYPPAPTAFGTGYSSSGYASTAPAGYATTEYSSAGVPPFTPGGSGSGKGRREPRRPGWGGVFAVGAGAAALASLLTAGIVLQTQDSNSGTTIANASSPTVKAPVTSSSTKTPDWGAVAKAVEPSVVAVQVTGQSAAGEGSGVILDKTGRIVTNNHVVSGVGSNPTIEVVLADGRKYPATVVGTDSSTDLAVIKLTNGPANLTPAVLGDASSVAVGDAVMAVGNPLGLSGTVTTGIVSATDRPTTTEAESADPTSGSSGEEVVTNAIQTDAAVNPGNSGGALVDSQGRVIGIPSSIASLSDGSSSFGGQTTQSGNIGLGFAIPIDEVKDVTSQLIKGGTVAHSWLGVGPVDASVKVDGASRDGATLKTISTDSPASKAGLKAGDTVIAVDGEAVNSAISLVGQLRERPVNTQVTLTIVRDGKATDVKVTLGTRPASAN
jgi:putative serine protease PepD